MDGNSTPNPNPWALEAYYPQQASLASQEAMLKNYVQQVENENHKLKQQMDLLKQTTHDKLFAMEQQFEEERRCWKHQFDQLQQRSQLENHQSTEQLRRDFQGEIDSIRAQLTKSHQETQQFQHENSTLRSSINKLQNENAELLRSKADAYEEMRTFTNKHRDVLADQDSKEKEIASLQTTTERLREDHLKLSSLNEKYLETISELQSTLQEICAAPTAPPNPQQSSTGPKMDSPDQQDTVCLMFNLRQAPMLTQYLGSTAPQQPVVHVNATGNSKENGYSKNRHPVQPFDGAPGTSSQLWLSHFDMVISYHDWPEDIQLMKEFMMAMTGFADVWWRSLSTEQKAHIKTARDAFDDHYGGEMSDLMETLHKLDTTHQGNETMITFGPKIQVMLEKVYEEKPHLQIHNFYQHVTTTVVDYVSASNPKTLKQAINTAINIERVRKNTGKGRKGASTTPVAPQFNAAWNPDAKNDPMEDVQVNAQHTNFKKFNNKKNKNTAKKDSSAACKVCSKTSHTTENCYQLNAAVQALKDKKATSKHVNTQSVALIKDSTKPSINNVEFDPTDNIFYQLHSNAQASVNDPNIPTVVGSDSSNPTSFVVPIVMK